MLSVYTDTHMQHAEHWAVLLHCVFIQAMFFLNQPTVRSSAKQPSSRRRPNFTAQTLPSIINSPRVCWRECQLATVSCLWDCDLYQYSLLSGCKLSFFQMLSILNICLAELMAPYRVVMIVLLTSILCDFLAGCRFWLVLICLLAE